MNGNLESPDRETGLGGSFLEAHFFQLQKLDGGSLAARQLRDRGLQGLRIAWGFRHRTRWIGVAFDCIRIIGDFHRPSALLAQMVNRSPAGNRGHPWQKWTIEVISMPDLMKGQQAVLNDILNGVAVMDLPTHDYPQDREQIRQKRLIDDGVAGKSRLHAV